MLIVPIRLRPSPIHGLGIFAAKRIPQGCVVWKYTEPVDQRIRGRWVPEAMGDFLTRFAYRPPGEDYLEVCGDAAIFLNHADSPNCRSEGDFTYALRDIEVDEELTEDYRTFNSLPMEFLNESASR